MKISDLLLEDNTGDFDVKIRISGADLKNIPDSLSYEVFNLVVETRNGAIRVPQGGVVNLSINPEILAKKVARATNFKAQELTNIELSSPLSDFKFDSRKSQYDISVEYIDESGNASKVNIPFKSVEFEPSDQLLRGLNKLK